MILMFRGRVTTPVTPSGQQTIEQLAAKASEAYDNAQSALSQGDWQRYGQYQAELKSYLDQMNALSNGASSTAAASADSAGKLSE